MEREEKEIILSDKHGLNPSMEVCLTCGKEMGIILFGNSYGKDDEAPMRVCIGTLCDDCKNIITNGGIWVIAVDSNKQPIGKAIALSREGASKLFDSYESINFAEERLVDTLLEINEYNKQLKTIQNDNNTNVSSNYQCE